MSRQLAVKRRMAVKIDGRDKETLVEIDEGGVRVDGQPFDVSVSEAEAGIWILRRGNEQTVAQVDGRGSKLTVEIRRPGHDAVVLAAEVNDARRAPVGSRNCAARKARRSSRGRSWSSSPDRPPLRPTNLQIARGCQGQNGKS